MSKVRVSEYPVVTEDRYRFIRSSKPHVEFEVDEPEWLGKVGGKFIQASMKRAMKKAKIRKFTVRPVVGRFVNALADVEVNRRDIKIDVHTELGKVKFEYEIDRDGKMSGVWVWAVGEDGEKRNMVEDENVELMARKLIIVVMIAYVYLLKKIQKDPELSNYVSVTVMPDGTVEAIQARKLPQADITGTFVRAIRQIAHDDALENSHFFRDYYRKELPVYLLSNMSPEVDDSADIDLRQFEDAIREFEPFPAFEVCFVTDDGKVSDTAYRYYRIHDGDDLSFVIVEFGKDGTVVDSAAYRHMSDMSQTDSSDYSLHYVAILAKVMDAIYNRPREESVATRTRLMKTISDPERRKRISESDVTIIDLSKKKTVGLSSGSKETGITKEPHDRIAHKRVYRNKDGSVRKVIRVKSAKIHGGAEARRVYVKK